MTTDTPRNGRALTERATLGRRLRAHRMALDYSIRDAADQAGTGKSQVHAIEHTTTDVLVGTLIDVAAAYGLNVALVGDHHQPLLDLTAAEVQALVVAAAIWAENSDDPDLHSALAKYAAANQTTNQTRTAA
jgi:transcriptional regulator with XRE-family HTH domain